MKDISYNEPVPFFGVQRENTLYEDEYCSVIRRTMRHGKNLQGPEIDAFEHAIADRCRRDYAVAVNSATDALFFALIGAGIGPGDEVVVTSFSFLASASAILRAGATPVFVDIDRQSFHMSLDHTRRCITERTKAIVVVHLFGQMVNPRAVQQLAEKSGLLIIEDAAQALGARSGEIPAGSLGLASAISFDPTKVISAPSTGGVVLTDDLSLRDRVRELRYHGRNSKGEFASLGYNSQMSSITAALLELKLARLEELQGRRQEIAKAYNEAFSRTELECPADIREGEHIYHKYVLVVPDGGADLREALERSGVKTMEHYRRPLPFEPLFSHLAYTPDAIPIASSLQGKLVSLPIHPYLRGDELERVISGVLFWARTRSPSRNRRQSSRGAEPMGHDNRIRDAAGKNGKELR